MITIIAAITADKGAIGRKGDMIYYISDDLKHFKKLTTGHTVVMGRKTFESLPKGALPNRRNIVVSRNKDFSPAGAEVAQSLEQAVEMCGDDHMFIIGGAQIYDQALEMADELALTIISAPTPGDADTFFPSINPEQWQIADESEHMVDAKTSLPFQYVTLRRAHGGFENNEK